MHTPKKKNGSNPKKTDEELYRRAELMALHDEDVVLVDQALNPGWVDTREPGSWIPVRIQLTTLKILQARAKEEGIAWQELIEKIILEFAENSSCEMQNIKHFRRAA